MGPGDQLTRQRDDGAPDAVLIEPVQGRIAQAAVFGGADAVLATRTPAVAQFELGQLSAVCVGGERGQSHAVGVGEPQLRSWMRFLFPDDDPQTAYRGPATGDRRNPPVPNAQLVVDHFHLVKLANDMVTAVRRRVTFDTHGRRGRTQDPEWANRRRLLSARERLSDRSFAKIWNTLIDHDPSAQILTAYIAKEELRQLLSAARDGADDADIRRRLYRSYTWCADADIPEITRLAATIETWWPAILAFLHTGLTNARTEGHNRLVKQVKRVACGFRNTEM